MSGRRIEMTAIAVLVGAIALSGCGSSTPIEESEGYLSIASAGEKAASDLAKSEEALETIVDDLAASEEALSKANADLADAEEALTASEVALSEVEEDLAATEESLATVEAASKKSATKLEEAEAEIQALRIQYDPQIRAELQGAVDAEVLRATGVASTEIDTPIDDIVEYDDAWASVATKQDVTNAVTAASAEARNRTAAEREAERLSSFVTVNVDEIIKNPAAAEGTDVVMFASIVQYDVNTGPCSFHANFAAEFSDRSFNYDERAQFGYGASELLQILNSDCPDLDGIDVDDFVKIWATGAGSYSYDTSIGGSNTVPVFDIVQIELVRKN